MKKNTNIIILSICSESITNIIFKPFFVDFMKLRNISRTAQKNSFHFRKILPIITLPTHALNALHSISPLKIIRKYFKGFVKIQVISWCWFKIFAPFYKLFSFVSKGTVNRNQKPWLNNMYFKKLSMESLQWKSRLPLEIIVRKISIRNVVNRFLEQQSHVLCM